MNSHTLWINPPSVSCMRDIRFPDGLVYICKDMTIIGGFFHSLAVTGGRLSIFGAVPFRPEPYVMERKAS
jgi:hypothetical protein